MATAVEVPSGYLLMSDPSPPLRERDRQATDRLRIQNSYLSYHITVTMLKADNLNGLHRHGQRFTHEVINEPGFKEAVATLEKACQRLKENRETEMESLVSTMDITDSQLCINYQAVARHLMQEDVRFGRICSFFYFTFVLCKRLHLRGRQREIESVIDWQARYLNEVVSPWLIQNHGGLWVSTIWLFIFMCLCS